MNVYVCCFSTALKVVSVGQEEVVNAAMVTVQHIASSSQGRERLAASSSIPLSIAERAIGTSGGLGYLLECLSGKKLDDFSRIIFIPCNAYAPDKLHCLVLL